jgi:molybdopterin molybdotransferase
MISVSEAKQIITGQDFQPGQQKISTLQAVNAVLAEPVYAICDIPGFVQSSMDGYAFRFEDWLNGQSLAVTTEVPAGKNEKDTLLPGQAARIFTGAALPDGADTVVMQEKASIENRSLVIADGQLKRGSNTRLKGAEIGRGDLAMDKNACLSAAAVGFLSGIGIAEVVTFSNPSVGIIITGNELQSPGLPLHHGQVYDASSSMLQAALYQMDIRGVTLYRSADTLQEVITQLNTALQTHDVVLITGGVSVGDYDFVVQACGACAVDTLFHRVKQRPGKPLFFGRKHNKPVFGLPGNPSSVLSCFYEYVWPLLRRLSGKPDALTTFTVPLREDYDKVNDLTQFLKGHYQKGEVQPLFAQESFRLRSFAMANCLIQLDEDMKSNKKGDLVEIHLLPVYG